jgi:adenylate kinase
MNLIFLGPPGAGKGTLAAQAAGALQAPHISTGDIFRAAIKAGTELGLKVKGIIDSGGLVSDDLTVALVKERLQKPDTAKGWILDGFPRTIPQAEALEKAAKVDAVVNFDVPNPDVIERLSGRRVCRGCSRNYHVKFLPPKATGKCDDCGGELYIRDDDKEEAIKHRLEVYRAQTEPLIGFYRQRGLIKDIDARGAPEKVYAEFEKTVVKK